MLPHRELPERIAGLAIEVHQNSRPGLLESFWVAAFCRVGIAATFGCHRHDCIGRTGR